MRSIGVFSPSGPQPAASQTSAHNGFYVMNRALSRTLAPGARLPKVGVMQSSQRTQIRSVQPAAGILGRTDFGGAQTTVVNDALRRARNAGSCAPKKKGAIRSVLKPPNTVRVVISLAGAYTLSYTSQGPYSIFTGFNGLDVSNISEIHFTFAGNDSEDLFFPAIYTPGGLQIPNVGAGILPADISFEYENLTPCQVNVNEGSFEIYKDYQETLYVVIKTPASNGRLPLNVTVPIDAYQSPMCSAYLTQYYAYENFHVHYYKPSATLTSYPLQTDEHLNCSVTC